jgi:hypothetical protein
MPKDYNVVVNDCASPPVLGLTHLRTRPTSYGARNFISSFQDIIGGLPERLTPIQQDWLHILTSIFAADVVSKRGAGDDWSRRIQLWIGVREPDHWKLLKPQIEQVFKSLTYDQFAVTFVADPDAPQTPRQDREAFPRADSVALVSGGIDSLTGAAKLLDIHRTPLFISHQNSGAVSDALQAVDEGLAGIGRHAGRRSFTAQKEGIDATESSQRSRSLLYMGVACLAAACLDISDVYLNENGIMAINVPLTPARIGSFSTHTCNPTIVYDVAQLAGQALGWTGTIHNIIVTSTKPEVVQEAAALGLCDVLPKTVSCWQIGRTRRHCGYCVPCLIRQISFEHAGLSDTPHESYPLDTIPDGGIRQQTATDNVTHLAAHVLALSQADEFELELDFTEMINCDGQLTRRQSIDMHYRWAEQCLTVLERHPHSAHLLGR